MSDKMVNKKDVFEALKEVKDPEIGLDVVSLGLIYKVEVKDSSVYILMTMTTPACPLTWALLKEVEEKVKQIKDVEKVKVDLTFNPPWTPDMMSDEAKKRLGFQH